MLNGDDARVQQAASRAAAQVFWFSRRSWSSRARLCIRASIVFRAAEGCKAEPVMPVAEIPLKGAHNVENVLAAVCAARLAGVPAEAIRASGARASRRWSIGWSLCATVRGVEYYNDSKATNVDATMKALSSFPGGVHLILGGKDKDSDYGEMAAAAAGAGEGCLHHWFGGGKD